MSTVNVHLILGSTVSMIIPARVVESGDDGLLLWVAPGTPLWRATIPPGTHLRDLPPEGSYPLRADRWRHGGALILQPAGAGHAVWWSFTPEQEFRSWYVNLESRVRTPDGADVRVTDQELDITVTPDRAWEWKDEESFAAKTGHPVYWTPAEAAAIRAEGVRVTHLIDTAAYPFDGTWCDFRPPPSWPLPPRPPLPLPPVTAPSGVLVLGKAGWIDHRRDGAPPLSDRALAMAASGGGHLHDGGAAGPEPWGFEAVAVPAATDRPLPVRAWTAPSPFDGEPVISALEISLGLPWTHGPDPVPLGDLPVDRCGMVLGDARALDAFEGLSGDAVDGLADVTYWGRHEDEAQAVFGGAPTPQNRDGSGPRGFLDLPLAEAAALAGRIEAWVREGPGNGLMVALDAHTDHHRFRRAGWGHPVLAGEIEVGGCRVLGLGWDPGDHSERHHGERAHGQVYPVTLEERAGEAVLRWVVPAYEAPPAAEGA
ncbi:MULTISPECIES: DUF402 domain-containing protein [unclassified Streptomyces]|uniref:DUF402 domain-containing protein n=1 Tax=unclassified Streptomyces TaxID=2593676 RepID=UPI00202F272D|nr:MULTISPECIES: DUF402 domain-containing protein [unclassified Streptomyces]MCM1972466.1 DUF402 domain-containing protein [Streptomyces sp. G1]MCX5122970.1 DUF402 domain-containing protein [Streptomyces sp. NBC_00347]